jgi:prepilin-type processing-associated H-X9-DG protein
MRVRKPSSSRSANRAFTLLELLVSIGIIMLLMGILLPAIEHVRHQAYIDKCASNLRQIGMSFQMYSNENKGNYPRTIYDPTYASPLVSGTGVNAPDPFLPGGVQPNDLTAAIFLLMKSQGIPPEVMICPYNDETSYEADSTNLNGRSNFTDEKKNLGYSFANPYPTAAVRHAGYQLTSHLPPDFAIAADRNPGVNAPRSDVYSATPTIGTKAMEKANSANHEFEGQNVLFADGHVGWCQTPFAGVNNDNIYTAKNGVSPTVANSPVDPSDSVLLPAASQ